MRHSALSGTLGIALAVVLALGVISTRAVAQADLDLLPFPRSSATITLTDSGMNLTPDQLNPGPITFTVVNNSSKARGVYITGQDSVGTPILRYSMRIRPGSSTRVDFWMYQGSTYAFRDFTSRRVIGDEMVFASTYSRQVTIPTPLPIGRGPQYDWKSGTITIASDGIIVTPMTTDLGPIVFTVMNQTSMSRGVVITGEDRSGSPIIRYSRMIRPGASTRVSFWLYEGKTYTIRDYTRRYTVGGEMRFDSAFRTQLMVNPGSPVGEKTR